MSNATLGAQARNTTQRYDFLLEGAEGRSLEGSFDGTEAFSAVLWAGDDRQVSATLEAGWLDHAADAPSWYLRVARAAIEGLDGGVYQVQVILSPGELDQPLLPPGTTIELLDAPGSSAAPLAYCSAQDLADECPWVEMLQSARDQTGYARQRHLALQWTQDLLHRHRRGRSGMDRQHARILGGAQRSGVRDRWLQDQLDAGRLIVSGAVRRFNALYALALVLRHQTGSRDGMRYRDLAAEFRAEAEDLAALTTAEIDLDGDGRGEVAIDLGSIDVLRG